MNGPLTSVKDCRLPNVLEVFILLNTLADFQHISGTKTGWVAHIFHYFSPWIKGLHWGGNHSLPRMMVTLPGDTVQVSQWAKEEVSTCGR